MTQRNQHPQSDPTSDEPPEVAELNRDCQQILHPMNGSEENIPSAEKQARMLALVGQNVVYFRRNMVTRTECDRRHARRFDWRTFAALMPGAIALLGFIATLIFRVF